MPQTKKEEQAQWIEILEGRKVYSILKRDISRVEFDVLTLVGAVPGITIQDICKSTLFTKKHLSSVKRAVDKLKAIKLIEAGTGTDGRIRPLYLKENKYD